MLVGERDPARGASTLPCQAVSGGPSVTEDASGKFHRVARRRASRSAFCAGLPTCTKPVASSQMNIPPSNVFTNEPPRTLISVVDAVRHAR